jgi:SAM-dependent methyltransferase
MTDPVDYWEQRAKQVSRLSALKRWPPLQWLLSVRIGDEAFIRRHLSRLGRPTVLDVACGVGKVQVSAVARRTYGVDITGFPKEVASGRGYRVVEYSPPDYLFDLPEPVDAIVCIDLNAHVEFESFAKIIRSVESHATASGRLLLIGEFDNVGIGYRLMKRAPARFQRYVLGMKHWHFARESEFVERFEAAFPQFRRAQRSEIVCVPPLSHFYACFANKDVDGAMMKAAFLVEDLGLSLLNNVLRFFPALDSAFRVGYVYERRNSP